jgi:hypothetical protein
MVRYLLGALSADERSRLEEQYMQDPASFVTLRSVESELINAWLLGRLSASDSELFAKEYLGSPERKKRIREAASLLAALQEQSAQEAFAPSEAAQRLWSFHWRDFGLMMAGSTVAATLCFVFLWPRLSEVQNQVQQSREQWTALRTELTKPPAQAIPNFLLRSNLTRSAGITDKLELPADAGAIHLHIELAGGEKVSAYSAALQTVEGEQRPISALDTVPKGAGGDMLQVTATLDPGDYILELRAKFSDGEYKPIGTFAFRIMRQGRPHPAPP